MRNYFKKFSIMFAMALMLMFGWSISAFADDSYEIGTVNYSATVGSQLTSPEKGWKRADDTNSSIKYDGNWSTTNNATRYKGALHYTAQKGASVSFKFYGTKLRYICETWSPYPSNVSIKIDDLPNGNINQSLGVNYQCVAYEKINLPLGIHNVVVKMPNEGSWMYGWLDAIDIDDTGYLVNTTESITLDKSAINLTQDDSGQLTATTTPAGAQVTWKSSDPSIATVDSTGKVTGVKEGTCTITAITADGLTATCVVTVTPKGNEPNPNPDPTDTDKIVNIAHAKGDNTNNAGGDVTIIFHGSADTTLSVVKTADVKDVWIGDNFTYTLVITNTGTKTAKAV
ncbi:Ig-like domain-containing protein, partial [Clostridium saccharoperbutylacetonicum]